MGEETRAIDGKFEVWWEAEYGYGDYGNPPAPAVYAYRAGYTAATERAEKAEAQRDRMREALEYAVKRLILYRHDDTLCQIEKILGVDLTKGVEALKEVGNE